jgi:hypothetical protein
MVQMPCPEQRVWGGVIKRRLLRAYGLKERHPLLYRVRWLLLPLALLGTRLAYRRLAREVAAQIEDYIVSGYRVMCVAGVDGSPTCAVKASLDARRLDALCAIPVREITPARQAAIMRHAVRPGRGLFIAELERELARRRITVPFTAHDLFAEADGQPSGIQLLPGKGRADRPFSTPLPRPPHRGRGRP